MVYRNFRKSSRNKKDKLKCWQGQGQACYLLVQFYPSLQYSNEDLQGGAGDSWLDGRQQGLVLDQPLLHLEGGSMSGEW